MPKPGTYSWLDGPSKPGPKKESLRILKDKHHGSQPHLGLTEVIATKLAIEALSKYERKYVEALNWWMSTSVLKEFPYRVFDEIDKELFRGVLQGNVYLHWRLLPPFVHGATILAGHRGGKRVGVALNTELLQMDVGPCVVLAALIHHMAHAYFLVCCGSPPRKEGSDTDTDTGKAKGGLGHGLGFSALVHRIMDVFVPKCRYKFPDLFSCYAGDKGWYYASARVANRKRKAHNTSVCCWGVRGYPSKGTCEDYIRGLQEISAGQKKDGGKGGKEGDKGEKEKGERGGEKEKEKEKENTVDPYPKSHYLHTVNTTTAQFTPVLRAQFSLKPSDYVEIQYQNYAIPIPRRNLTTFPSLLQKPTEPRTDPLILTVPPSTPTPIFLALYSYIFELDYPPSLKPVTSPTLGGGKAGPPIIKSYKQSEPPYLQTDIQVYTLASNLHFTELRAKALARLYSQTVTHNDPMSALEKIYHQPGKEKDKGAAAAIEIEEDKHPLRSWARAFLSKTHPDGAATNLAILQRSEQWKARFAALRGRGGEFLADCDAAGEGIALKNALMRAVGGAKGKARVGGRGGEGEGEEGDGGRSQSKAEDCGHRSQNLFSGSNSPVRNMYDLEPERFDFYGLPHLDRFSVCRSPSPSCLDSPLNSLHQLPPSVLQQLHGYLPNCQSSPNWDGKRKVQEPPRSQGNDFGERGGSGSTTPGGWCCEKCARG
ncbi:hypothetical protein FQN54_007915 [Arachnomyces sp. PD_36]|nr:hypothetical protein FQN54_007915 [Arachnomyces sp. PD_36]